MKSMSRTATIQARVSPRTKHESERVLHRLGLTMSEAMELFVLRLIQDEKLPFEIEALDWERG